mgnify:CR=1 FL=1
MVSTVAMLLPPHEKNGKNILVKSWFPWRTKATVSAPTTSIMAPLTFRIAGMLVLSRRTNVARDKPTRTVITSIRKPMAPENTVNAPRAVQKLPIVKA